MNLNDTSITQEEIEKFRKHGLLNETGLRNIEIKQKFADRSARPGIKKCKVIDDLAEEYHLGVATINRIVYG